MPSCAIKWCGKNSSTSSSMKDGISFHKFPNDPTIKEAWINSTHKDNFFPRKDSVVCSRHFTSDCFENLKGDRRRIFASAVPTLYLPILTIPANTTDPQEQPSPSDNIKMIKPSTSMTVSTFSTDSQDPLSLSDRIEFVKPSVGNSPNSSKKIQIDDEQYENMTAREQKMDRHIFHLKYSLKRKNKTVKRYQDKTRLLKKRVATLKEILNTLSKTILINKDKDDFLEKIMDILRKHRLNT